MAYGEGKRVNAERSFGMISIFGLGLIASLGIGAAVIVDLLQQREASALFVINRWMLEVTSLLGVQAIPLYILMLVLMGIGGFSVMFLQPVTFRGAFAQGFGLLAIIVTIAPSDLGAPLEAPSGQPPVGTQSSFEVTPASLAQRGSNASQDEYQLRIQIEFPEGLNGNIDQMIRRNRLAGKLWNPNTGMRYNLFRNSGAEVTYRDGTLQLRTTIDAGADKGDLWILVEAEGYAIKEQAFLAQKGANGIWRVRMEPSDEPLFLQRLRHSYRF